MTIKYDGAVQTLKYYALGENYTKLTFKAYSPEYETSYGTCRFYGDGDLIDSFKVPGRDLRETYSISLKGVDQFKIETGLGLYLYNLVIE